MSPTGTDAILVDGAARASSDRATAERDYAVHLRAASEFATTTVAADSEMSIQSQGGGKGEGETEKANVGVRETYGEGLLDAVWLNSEKKTPGTSSVSQWRCDFVLKSEYN